MIKKAVPQWSHRHNNAHGSLETNQNYIKNDFSVMKKRCSGAEELQKANGTGSCISLSTVDWQVVSVDCLSALWHYSPISAGFRNDLKNIWGVEKKMRPLILFLRRKNLKNRGWSGHLEEWDHSVNVRGRQQQYKHNKQMSHSVWFYIILAIWIHSSVYMCMACVRACMLVCVCVWCSYCINSSRTY